MSRYKNPRQKHEHFNTENNADQTPSSDLPGSRYDPDNTSQQSEQYSASDLRGYNYLHSLAKIRRLRTSYSSGNNRGHKTSHHSVYNNDRAEFNESNQQLADTESKSEDIPAHTAIELALEPTMQEEVGFHGQRPGNSISQQTAYVKSLTNDAAGTSQDPRSDEKLLKQIAKQAIGHQSGTLATAETLKLAPDQFALTKGIILLSVKQIAALFNVTPKLINKKIAEGNFPAPINLSERVPRYRLIDLEQYLETCLAAQ